MRSLRRRATPAAHDARHGVTLVEIMVASTIIVLLAAVSFPVYKLIQQRDKENRLREALDNMRNSIYGNIVANANRTFNKGYRLYVINELANQIDLATITESTRKDALATGILDLVTRGLDLPYCPASLTGRSPLSISFTVATGPSISIPTAGTAAITGKRIFLRSIPPHPFVGWNPNARWEFEPAFYSGAPNTTHITLTATSAADWTGIATGVKNIVSRGAGMALDGSNTDDW